jgi:hypothetical protein
VFGADTVAHAIMRVPDAGGQEQLRALYNSILPPMEIELELGSDNPNMITLRGGVLADGELSIEIETKGS